MSGSLIEPDGSSATDQHCSYEVSSMMSDHARWDSLCDMNIMVWCTGDITLGPTGSSPTVMQHFVSVSLQKSLKGTFYSHRKIEIYRKQKKKRGGGPTINVISPHKEPPAPNQFPLPQRTPCTADPEINKFISESIDSFPIHLLSPLIKPRPLSKASQNQTAPLSTHVAAAPEWKR